MKAINSLMDWVAAYPKSGNTWVRMLLKSYLDTQVADYDDSGLMWFQAASSYPATTLEPWQEVQLRGAALYNIAVAANNTQTLIKTHHAFVEIAGIPLFSQAFVRRAVYVIRDPRDVACSMAHHFNMTTEEAVQFMGRPSQLGDEGRMHHHLATWSGHVTSWTTQQRVTTIITRYEDLTADTAKELRDIVTAMDWEVDEARIARAVEANEFKKLQAHEKEHGFHEAKPHGPFFRRGEVGAWRDELATDLVERIEREHGEVMIKQGYDLEYAQVMIQEGVESCR